MLVIAQKLDDASATMAAPQQSDYAQSAWMGSSTAGAAPDIAGAPDGRTGTVGESHGRNGIVAALASLGVLDVARRSRERWRALTSSGLSLPAPDYTRLDVAALLRPARASGMTSADATRPLRVLVLCESLGVTGGVERFVCDLGQCARRARHGGDARQRRHASGARRLSAGQRGAGGVRRAPAARRRVGFGTGPAVWRCCGRGGAWVDRSVPSSVRCVPMSSSSTGSSPRARCCC